MLESHRRPVAPWRIGSLPWMSDESIRWLVKLTRAVMPWTAWAVRAAWIALARGLGGGTGPPLVAASAIAVPPAAATTNPTIIANSR